MATAARVDSTTRVGLERGRRLRSGLGHAATVRIDAAAGLAPEAPQGVPELGEKIGSGRFEGLRRPRALRGPRPGGIDPRRGEKGNQQDKNRRTTERPGHHGGSLESAPPRSPWPRGQALQGKEDQPNITYVQLRGGNKDGK